MSWSVRRASITGRKIYSIMIVLFFIYRRAGLLPAGSIWRGSAHAGTRDE